MNTYQFLKKCRGTCEKGKKVNETNCIGTNPQHSDCKYCAKNGFVIGHCPYYQPNVNEKNYTNDIENVEGIRYIRQPFQVLWYFVIFMAPCSLLFSVALGGLNSILFFIKPILVLSIFVLLISSLGNFLYVKIKGKKLVAIVNDDGIYTPRLFLSWDKMEKVKIHHDISRHLQKRAYFVALECVMKVDEEIRYREYVFIYFSTFKMRKHIKRCLKQYRAS